MEIRVLVALAKLLRYFVFRLLTFERFERIAVTRIRKVIKTEERQRDKYIFYISIV